MIKLIDILKEIIINQPGRIKFIEDKYSDYKYKDPRYPNDESLNFIDSGDYLNNRYVLDLGEDGDLEFVISFEELFLNDNIMWDKDLYEPIKHFCLRMKQLNIPFDFDYEEENGEYYLSLTVKKQDIQPYMVNINEIKVVPPTPYKINPNYESYMNGDTDWHEIRYAEGDEIAKAVTIVGGILSDGKKITLNNLEKFIQEDDGTMWEGTAEELLEFLINSGVIIRK